ncbi:MAG: ribonuclease HII [Candidatus Aenigmarchaeota archaeon]|nr:ribonuclease HII [Candidatus Aenigmarchaeota archaeon]
MVVVGLSIEASKEDMLKKLGVKDSKLLKPHQREHLAEKIEEVAKDTIILKISPCKIDNSKKKGINLNRLEAMKFAEIINLIKPDRAIIDCPDTNCGKFKLIVKKMLDKETELIVEHKADVNYPIVSAASIIAKVMRDEEIEKIKKKYGMRGNGYSHDEETIEWLREWLRSHKELPDFVRKSWDTTRRLLAEKKQNKLNSFFGKIKNKNKPC